MQVARKRNWSIYDFLQDTPSKTCKNSNVSPKLKNTRAAKIPLCWQRCSFNLNDSKKVAIFGSRVNFPLVSLSISFLPPSPPLLSFTIYNGGVSSVAEERLSSVRLTPSSSLLKQFDYFTKQCLSLPLTDALLSMRSCNKICNCRAFKPFRK